MASTELRIFSFYYNCPQSKFAYFCHVETAGERCCYSLGIARFQAGDQVLSSFSSSF